MKPVAAYAANGEQRDPEDQLQDVHNLAYPGNDLPNREWYALRPIASDHEHHERADPQHENNGRSDPERG